MTLAPDPIAQDTDTQDAQPASSSENPSLDELAAIVGDIEGNAYDETVANELLESLLELPDTELGGVEEIADIPPLEEPALGEVDHLSPSDTVTTASVSSLASPPANGERSVKFDLSGTHLPSTGLQANDTSHNSIFLPGIVEDDLVFPFSSPSFTPTRQSRFLQNPTSPSSNFKALASPYLVTSNLDQNQHAMHDFLYSSPSRHTAFDIDLMPEFAFDNLIPA